MKRAIVPPKLQKIADRQTSSEADALVARRNRPEGAAGAGCPCLVSLMLRAGCN